VRYAVLVLAIIVGAAVGRVVALRERPVPAAPAAGPTVRFDEWVPSANGECVQVLNVQHGHDVVKLIVPEASAENQQVLNGQKLNDWLSNPPPTVPDGLVVYRTSSFG
jgi:hypothetical protein